jgi:hemerythrin-like domain-containing protein
MNNATGILRKEHDAILRMLEVTEEVARRLDSGASVPPTTLRQLHEFFRVFADTCHHGKEENLLFPALEKKGMPREGGPIGVMLTEHDQGRAFIKQMVEASQAYSQNAKDAGLRWSKAARGYSELLRNHIAKENEVLFVMAERMLSPTDQEKLADEFEKVEIEKIGAGTHERLHGLIGEIVREFLKPKA